MPLTLTRRPGEAIQVGKDIKITVVEVKGKKVRVVIDAPRTTAIHRSENLPDFKDAEHD